MTTDDPKQPDEQATPASWPEDGSAQQTTPIDPEATINLGQDQTGGAAGVAGMALAGGTVHGHAFSGHRFAIPGVPCR